MNQCFPWLLSWLIISMIVLLNPGISVAQDVSSLPGMETVTRFLEENNPAKAIEQLNAMLEKAPDDKHLLIIRGRILYLTLNKPLDGLKDFNKAIAIDPGWFQAYKRRGEYFAHVGKTDEALADFSKCISLAPKYGEVYLSRATLYSEEGKYQEALFDLDMAKKYHTLHTDKLAKLRTLCVNALKKGTQTDADANK